MDAETRLRTVEFSVLAVFVFIIWIVLITVIIGCLYVVGLGFLEDVIVTVAGGIMVNWRRLRWNSS